MPMNYERPPGLASHPYPHPQRNPQQPYNETNRHRRGLKLPNPFTRQRLSWPSADAGPSYDPAAGRAVDELGRDIRNPETDEWSRPAPGEEWDYGHREPPSSRQFEPSDTWIQHHHEGGPPMEQGDEGPDYPLPANYQQPTNRERYHEDIQRVYPDDYAAEYYANREYPDPYREEGYEEAYVETPGTWLSRGEPWENMTRARPTEFDPSWSGYPRSGPHSFNSTSPRRSSTNSPTQLRHLQRDPSSLPDAALRTPGSATKMSPTAFGAGRHRSSSISSDISRSNDIAGLRLGRAPLSSQADVFASVREKDQKPKNNRVRGHSIATPSHARSNAIASTTVLAMQSPGFGHDKSADGSLNGSGHLRKRPSQSSPGVWPEPSPQTKPASWSRPPPPAKLSPPNDLTAEEQNIYNLIPKRWQIKQTPVSPAPPPKLVATTPNTKPAQLEAPSPPVQPAPKPAPDPTPPVDVTPSSVAAAEAPKLEKPVSKPLPVLQTPEPEIQARREPETLVAPPVASTSTLPAVEPPVPAPRSVPTMPPPENVKKQEPPPPPEPVREPLDPTTLHEALRFVVWKRKHANFPDPRAANTWIRDPVIERNRAMVGASDPLPAEPEHVDVVQELAAAETPEKEAARLKVKASLAERFAQREAVLHEKVEKLRQEYLALHIQWVAQCTKMEEPKAAAAATEDAPAVPMGRTTRRSAATFGDAVRSDFELEQVMEMSREESRTDPHELARRNIARIPDMLSVTPGGTGVLYDDTNNRVADPQEFYAPRSGFDDWTEEEKETFMHKYAAFPKQFGAIAEFLPHKTPAQCVAYYYLHKKKFIDFRKVVTIYAPAKRKRGGGRGVGKGKGNALLADIRIHDAEVSVRKTRGRKPAIFGADAVKPPLSRRKGAEFDGTPGSTPTPEPDGRRRRRAVLSTRAAAPPDDDDEEEDDDPRPAKRGRKPGRKAKVILTSAEPTPPPGEDIGRRKQSLLNNVPWSEEDRSTFLKLLALHGSDFKRIAASMPNKTTSQVHSYFKLEEAFFRNVASQAPRRSDSPGGSAMAGSSLFPGTSILKSDDPAFASTFRLVHQSSFPSGALQYSNFFKADGSGSAASTSTPSWFSSAAVHDLQPVGQQKAADGDGSSAFAGTLDVGLRTYRHFQPQGAAGTDAAGAGKRAAFLESNTATAHAQSPSMQVLASTSAPATPFVSTPSSGTFPYAAAGQPTHSYGTGIGLPYPGAMNMFAPQGPRPGMPMPSYAPYVRTGMPYQPSPSSWLSGLPPRPTEFPPVRAAAYVPPGTTSTVGLAETPGTPSTPSTPAPQASTSMQQK